MDTGWQQTMGYTGAAEVTLDHLAIRSKFRGLNGADIFAAAAADTLKSIDVDNIVFRVPEDRGGRTDSKARAFPAVEATSRSEGPNSWKVSGFPGGDCPI